MIKLSPIEVKELVDLFIFTLENLRKGSMINV